MPQESVFKRVWLEQDYTMDNREYLQRAVLIRARSAAQGLIRAFVRGEFQRTVDALQLVDDFSPDDRSPSVISIERGFEFGLASRCTFMNGTRLLLILSLPDENRHGLFDLELELKVGVATIVQDNWRSTDINAAVLNNRLRFVGEPDSYRLTSSSTAEELLKEVAARLKVAIARGQGTRVAAA